MSAMYRMNLAGGAEQTAFYLVRANDLPRVCPSALLSAVHLLTRLQRYSRRFCVRRVEELFAFAKHILVLCPAGQRTAVQDGSRPSCAEKVEAQVNAAQARVNNLTQSILAKAIRGELTADDKLRPCSLPCGPASGRSNVFQTHLWRAANPELISGDNSATALLERIKAEREALAVKKKPAKKQRAKKAKA